MNPLHLVFTAREAKKRWGLAQNTVTKWCNRGKFGPDEARKSEKIWLVTHDGMVRVTQPQP